MTDSSIENSGDQDASAPSGADGGRSRSRRPRRRRRERGSRSEGDSTRRARSGRGGRSNEAGSPLRVLARSEHPISRSNIDSSATKVLYRLDRKGHKAYLVGGSVRDLMLGGEPKDFDVATDAEPIEVRRLFRNSRIIGRRFRLVHVMFSDGIVEVATFRAKPAPGEQKRKDGELLITSDNTFGTPREDAYRRDFTINALFYDVSDFSVIDYVGGIDDLEKRVVRVIGDPDVRFKEDPVRMLRACEFAGRLDFTIDEETQAGIRRQRREIEKASPARLIEELLQLLRSGAAAPAVQWMIDLDLLQLLLPFLYVSIVEFTESGDFSRILPAIDRAISDGAGYSDATLLAALLVPAIVEERFKLESKSGHGVPRKRLNKLNERAIASLGKRFALSNVKTQQTLNTLDTFQRMCEPIEEERDALHLAGRSSFSSALDLFGILAEATGEGQDAYAEWKTLRGRGKRGGPPEREVRRRSRGGRNRGGRGKGGRGRRKSRTRN